MEVLSIFLCFLFGYASATDDGFDVYNHMEVTLSHLFDAAKALPQVLQKAVAHALIAEFNIFDASVIGQPELPSELVDRFNYWRIELKKTFLKEYDKAKGNGTDAARELAEKYMVVQDFNMENYLKKCTKYSPFMDNSSAALKDYETLKQVDLSGLDSTKEAEERERFVKLDREKFEGEVKAKSSEWQQVINKETEGTLTQLKQIIAWIDDAKSTPGEWHLNWLNEKIDNSSDFVHTVFGRKSPARCETCDPVKFFSDVPMEYEHMLAPKYFKQTFELDYNVAQNLRHYLHHSIRQKVLTTDTNEDMVMLNYAKSGSVPSDVLAAYNEAKKEERQFLKQFKNDSTMINIYKRLRKGEAWDYIKHDDRYKALFEKPSAALTAYEALKKDETASLDDFLSEQRQVVYRANANAQAEKVYERKSRAQAQEVEAADVVERKLRAEDKEPSQLVKATDGTAGVLTKTGLGFDHDGDIMVKFAIGASFVIEFIIAVALLFVYRKLNSECCMNNKSVKAPFDEVEMDFSSTEGQDGPLEETGTESEMADKKHSDVSEARAFNAPDNE